MWRAADVADPTTWTFELTEDHRREIVAAARSASTSATPSVTEPASFPLPTLGPEIARWTAELAHGRAFQLVRGFPVDELDPDETRAAFLGLGARLGVPVGQNRSGEILTDIRDERLPAEEPHVRRYRTRLRQDFHTDGADIVGLLCLHTALRGGESRIASAGAVYNALLESRPDLLEVLHRPFHWDRQGEEAPGEQPWFELPPLSDDAVVQIHDFLYGLLDLFEARYGDQIHRCYDELSQHRMIQPDPLPDTDDPPF